MIINYTSTNTLVLYGVATILMMIGVHLGNWLWVDLSDHKISAEFAGDMSCSAAFRITTESSPGGGGDTPYIPPKTGIE